MKNIHKYYILPASPEEVYTALTNPLTIELWTDSAAIMVAEPDTEFSMWDGSITGKNLAFEQNKRIEQEWYFGSSTEKSIVTIKLHPHKKGTSAELSHTNIPDDDFVNISEGWDESYMGSLIDFFNL
ncbi:MAG: SRPBCC domain-containing protein [Bacteroidales bacterium]|nr:SRPBCC domain-containing protein [Bacteroidales bacterium]MCF8404271.1 SRPBCC domain-containing protein [Bacteroidales bacterium]